MYYIPLCVLVLVLVPRLRLGLTYLSLKLKVVFTRAFTSGWYQTRTKLPKAVFITNLSKCTRPFY